MSDGLLRWWAPHALPVTAPPARDVLVTVDPASGRIVELQAKVSRERAIELGAELHDECAIAPGFVDTHAHLEYAAYDALVDGLTFTQWIGDHIHRKRRLAPEHMRASAELGALQALHAGITTVGDASFSGDAAHAMHAAGLRGRVYLEVFGSGEDDQAAATVDAALRQLDGLPSSDLLEHGLSPHAPYTVGEPLYRRVASTGLPWMTHLLESRDELAFLEGRGELFDSLTRAGIEPPQWMQAPIDALADVLGPEVVAVHLTQATPAQLEVLADTGTALAHCPRSNARLGCGRLDLELVDRAGIMVGLGTDSPASSGPLDPFAELRCALEVHRATSGDATWPSLARLLRMATLDAARALGYSDLGSIDVDSHADLVAVHVGTCDDPLAAYVLGATPASVQAVLVAGRDMGVRDRTRLEQAQARARDARTLLALPVRREGRAAGTHA
ncbi:MAG: amidohydrolase [Thermoleophilia bacterium]|nr:amidohydrolase [Thermoleophilia bacterium]